MDTKTKELIDSLISYMKTGEAQGCFKKKFKHLDESEISSVVARILSWQSSLARGLEDVSSLKFNLYGIKNDAEKVLYVRFKAFFDNCKDINKVFTLTKSGVEWNGSISDDLKLKIIAHIDENHQAPRSIYRKANYKKE